MKDKFILLIDDSLLNLFQEQDEQDQNKHLLSFLNGFESGGTHTLIISSLTISVKQVYLQKKE